jgi:hypothetical protein
MLSFRTHPAAITIGSGFEAAFDYFQRTWQKWLPVVGVAALIAFVLYLMAGAVPEPGSWTTRDIYGHAHIDGGAMARYYLVSVSSSIVTLVAGCVFYATAICGLRNRPLETGWLLFRGLLAFLTSLLIGTVTVVVVIVVAIVAIVLSIVLGPIGTLLAVGLITAAIVGAVYVGIRIVFAPVAVFDGFNPIEAIQESWRLSKGSVLRMLGWGFVAGLIGVGFWLLAAMASLPFTIAGLAPLSKAISTLIALVGTCFVAYLLSVLYESERAIKYPNIYGYAPVFGYPPYAGTDQYPGAPAGYPSPYPGAGPYPGQFPGQFPGAPYPVPAHFYPGQLPMSGWGDPTQIAPAPQPPFAPSGPPQGAGGLPYQGAVPGYAGSQPPRWEPQSWPVSPPDQAPPPTDPPANS